MKNTFKKIAASIMAMTTLAVSVVSFNASAATGYTSGMSGGTGSLTVSDGYVYASTTSGTVQYLYVAITKTEPAGNTDSQSSKTRQSVEARVYGSYSHAWSYHQTASGSQALSVSR